MSLWSRNAIAATFSNHHLSDLFIAKLQEHINVLEKWSSALKAAVYRKTDGIPVHGGLRWTVNRAEHFAMPSRPSMVRFTRKKKTRPQGSVLGGLLESLRGGQ